MPSASDATNDLLAAYVVIGPRHPRRDVTDDITTR